MGTQGPRTHREPLVTSNLWNYMHFLALIRSVVICLLHTSASHIANYIVLPALPLYNNHL